ncbi:LGFP repeat-containing protein [Nocardia sp. NPDC127579]|uniref:LGFP repeat-containing protein n=1 Tax=Nocardia sp. NPDC127579 TaxID=3345402 RepID=UPI003643B897
MRSFRRTDRPAAAHQTGAVATALVAVGLALTMGAATAGARPVGPFEVGGAIEAEFDRAGGTAALGEPTAAEADAANGGKFQTFANNAAIYWSAATDAHVVSGPIRDKWVGLGAENGALRYPVTSESPAGSGLFAHFQGGSIYYSVGTDAHQIGGYIRDKWGQLGWENSPLGFPLTDEAAGAKGGRYNLFPGGAIYWSAKTGAHAVWGSIRDSWARAGGDGGRYGYPTSDEYDYQGGKAQDFQGGRITWQP